MKISKRDFIRFVGGSSAALTVSSAKPGPMVSVAHPSPETLEPAIVPLQDKPASVEALDKCHDWYEVVDGKEWDRITFNQGVMMCMNWGMFVAGAFHECPYTKVTKDRTRTSLYNGGCFSAPDGMWVKAINVKLFNPTPSVKRIAASYAWVLWIANKSYVLTNSTRDGDVVAFPATKGLYIPPSCHFHISFESSSTHLLSDGAFDLQIEFDGVRIRGVQ